MSRKPGDAYRPCNGTEGLAFFEDWCNHCERDKVLNGTADADAALNDPSLWCEIVNRSYGDGPLPEWVWGADGRPQCLKFVRLGEPVINRCERTADMFSTEDAQ